jgi:hypothetical protein
MKIFWRYARVAVLLGAFSFILVFRGRESGPLAMVYFGNLFGRWPLAQVPGWCGYLIGALAPLVRSDRLYARLFTLGWACLVFSLGVVLSGASLLIETVISGSLFAVMAVALPWYEWFRASLETA